MRTSFADHFSEVSAHYAQFRPRYPDDLFSYLAALPARRECAWDCATGSGQAALPLARFFVQVVASDASLRQISKAARDSKLHYFVAAAEACGLRPASVDLVTVAQALHWFDLSRFYLEADRVLRPGGVLAVWNYGRLQVSHPVMQTLLQHFYDDIVSPYWPPERRLVEEGYRSLVLPFRELQSPVFALTANWTMHHLAGYLRTWSATQRFIAARRFDPVTALMPQLAPYWGSAETTHRLSWPVALRVGIKSLPV
jgi:ubiquinone/menaquinone biosynthesis C-methylase UbiE